MSISRNSAWALAAALLVAVPAMAQDEPASAAEETTETDAGAQTTEATPAPAPQDEPDPYVKETHGDWEVRCIPSQSGGEDPCQIFQLLLTNSGNPVAEMTVFPLEGEPGPAIAGSTISVPLQTLLSEGLAISIDGGPQKRYPFTFCQPTNCVARLGFTADDLSAFRRGAVGTLRLVPLSAPDQEAFVEFSLTGFTAAYAALEAEN